MFFPGRVPGWWGWKRASAQIKTNRSRPAGSATTNGRPLYQAGETDRHVSNAAEHQKLRVEQALSIVASTWHA
jgi:hypothetical protein